ncbi:hypothetical protein GMOD_00010344 [Pyrenophora seminiperda CCB06]|uniref:Uncharacterized protein n=1 Tax=Pyrenophora seminiperda CCB06 TaxID=1302712 RepID=A0A3M7M5I7_9PLEO|nr:hypothetical protein GMOD_00010344 [Pyrenophora seminiperda CCB06]
MASNIGNFKPVVIYDNADVDKIRILTENRNKKSWSIVPMKITVISDNLCIYTLFGIECLVHMGGS